VLGKKNQDLSQAHDGNSILNRNFPTANHQTVEPGVKNNRGWNAKNNPQNRQNVKTFGAVAPCQVQTIKFQIQSKSVFHLTSFPNPKVCLQ